MLRACHLAVAPSKVAASEAAMQTSRKSSHSPPETPSSALPAVPEALRQRATPFEIDAMEPIRPSADSTIPLRRSVDLEAGPPRVPTPPAPRRTWAETYNACVNHPAMRYVPIYAACVTTVGVYFGIRNYLFLDAAKTFSLVTRLQPVLTSAHRNISCALSGIQEKYNITQNRINCPPP